MGNKAILFGLIFFLVLFVIPTFQRGIMKLKLFYRVEKEIDSIASIIQVKRTAQRS